jgi:hypothetical protein
MRIVPSASWGRYDFWQLLSLEVNHWITSQPIEDVIPLLRHLIDAYWEQPDDSEPPADIDGTIHCLLYYAWDRAREVEDLRRRVHEMETRLFSLTAGQS